MWQHLVQNENIKLKQKNQKRESLMHTEYFPTRRLARGGALGVIAHPQFGKFAPKILRLVKRLVCKPKKYFSAFQRNCLNNLSYFNF